MKILLPKHKLLLQIQKKPDPEELIRFFCYAQIGKGIVTKSKVTAGKSQSENSFFNHRPVELSY